ncbi:putative uncharacterized protein C8orf89 homolog isoform X5 [Malaclemys terrapin pileata]|uniref:putative uncharacterized protein C8orf89 homolog isoform X5 n=1 Tax=Malaclemys terrapin pileata TaxID=2991368 RepID=UPI0023A8AC92|nr:putative uncharacterized protein C8orf89 homolog isoform X5 [Malaclemys terrapin pileata]
MSRNQPRWGHRESYVKDIKYPESSFLSECRSLSSQASKEQKMPSLMSDHKYLNNKASGRSLGCFPFESNWRSALLKTERIKKEYSSTFDLRDCEESAAVPNLTQGVQSYQENPSPILQMKKGFAYGAAKPFPTGWNAMLPTQVSTELTYINRGVTFLNRYVSLHSLPCLPSLGPSPYKRCEGDKSPPCNYTSAIHKVVLSRAFFLWSSVWFTNCCHVRISCLESFLDINKYDG